MTKKQTKCIVCPPGKEKPVHRRGLCTTHYAQFLTHLNSKTPEKQAVFEEVLMMQGKLLPKEKPGKKAANDPFAIASRQIDNAELGYIDVTTGEKAPSKTIAEGKIAAAAFIKRERKAGKLPPPKEIVPVNKNEPVKGKK
jgi:hypothetical protein